MSRNTSKYICPLCFSDGYTLNDVNYTISKLKEHFTTYHNRPIEANWKIQCGNCIRKKENGFLNVRINTILASNFLKHMQRHGCFKINEDINSNSDENLSNSILEEFNAVEVHTNQEESMEIDDMMTDSLENVLNDKQNNEKNPVQENIYVNFDENSSWTVQQKNVIQSILENFNEFFQSDYNTFQNLQRFLISQKNIILLYNDSKVANVVEDLLQIVKSRPDNIIQFCSPFSSSEEIYEEVRNLRTGEIQKINVTDNKRYMGAHITFSYILNKICINHPELLSNGNNSIDLLIYADELSTCAFNDGFSEFLHVALRPIMNIKTMAKISSIYSIGFLPTFGIKKFGGKPTDGRYYEFFKKLFERFNNEKTIKYQGKEIKFNIIKIIGDHCLLDSFFNTNSANGQNGSIPSCRICLICPKEYHIYNTVQKIENSDKYRTKASNNPFFGVINSQIYSDYFHDICLGLLPNNMYIAFQKICRLEIPEVNIYTLSCLLLQYHLKRGKEVLQNVKSVLSSNLISSKLTLTSETYRKAINFHSGIGNVEVGHCLLNLLQDLFIKSPNETLLLCKRCIKCHLDLYELCTIKNKLTDEECQMLVKNCNDIVETSLKMSENQYGFSKKLHYVLHYNLILKENGGTFCGIGTHRFEAAHQPCKKYYLSTKNHKIPAYTMLRKILVKDEISTTLKKYLINILNND